MPNWLLSALADGRSGYLPMGDMFVYMKESEANLGIWESGMVSLVYGTRPGLLESGLASTRGHIDACTTRQCRTSVCMYAIAGAVDTIGPYHVVLIYDACVLSRRCDWVDDMQFFAHTYVPPHEIRRRGWKGGGRTCRFC